MNNWSNCYIKAVLENPDWDIILLNHTKIQRPWIMLPWWKVEVWESQLEAITRELQEELWITLIHQTVQLLIHQLLLFTNTQTWHYGTIITANYTGEVQIQEDETVNFGSQISYIPKNDFKKPIEKLHESNRLMLLQALRVKEQLSQWRYTGPQVNVTYI